mmetsp:Transcript_47658/g.123579  ORF Transcript_47658/g.123579 Transcript_47658/m.123579 type:complete len:436 (-) Transcript_47658:1605-2912(-)
MISAVYFINLKGDILIFRTYRDDVSRPAADQFRLQVIAAREFRAPVKLYDNTTFLHIRHGNVYIVAATKHNVNTTMVFQFLYTLVEVMKSYFGGKVDEQTIQQNFVVIYELLDEMLDFGYPQNCTADTLKMYIIHGTQKTELLLGGKKSERAPNVPVQVTGAISWRREGIKYRKNELFLDVMEKVNVLVSSQGTVLKSDVTGSVQMRSYLSGMPECRFGMNDKLVMEKEGKSTVRNRRKGDGIAIDDVQFHQCVKLGKFDTDRTVSFVPPDGEFELMKYRCAENIRLPFKLHSNLKEHGRTRMDINVKVKSSFSNKLFGQSVVVKVPVPHHTSHCDIRIPIGKAKYEADQNAIVWKVKKFGGEMEYDMQAEVTMSSTLTEKTAWSRPPIEMSFSVPMFTASGLHVRFLKVLEKSNYQTTKWVRYDTANGAYLNRL